MNGLPPGLLGYEAARQANQQAGASNIQQLGGLLSIQNQMAEQQMTPLKQALLGAQVQGAIRKAKLLENLDAQNLSDSGASPMGGSNAGLASTPGINPTIRAYLLSEDPGYVALGKAMLEQQKPVNVRPGGTVYVPGQGPVYSAPAGGIQIQNSPQGPQAIPVSGYAQAAAAQAAPVAMAKAGGEAAGKAPYEVSAVNTPGAPTLMTRQQQIEGATGAPMPQPFGMQIPPAVQQQRDAEGARIRQAELQPNGGGMIPTPRVVQGSRAGMPLQSQSQSAEETHTGTEIGKQYGVVITDAAKSAVANRYLDVMSEYAKDFSPGKLAPLQNNLTQWAQALGIKVSDEDKKAAGSIQGLTSMAIKLAGQATRQSDAQPSQLQYFKILESMPNAERTPEGFARIINYMRDLNNINIIKAQKQEEWKSSHGDSVAGFEAAWPAMMKQLPFSWNMDKAISDAGTLQSKGVRRYNPSTGRIE